MKRNQINLGSKFFLSFRVPAKYCLRSTMALVLAFTAFNANAYNATGNEDRCEALGANCVCSEPMNTNNLPTKGNQYTLDPQDTTAKECTGFDGVVGGVIVGNNQSATPTNFIAADNSSSVLGALPAGNNVNYVIRGSESNVGSSFAPFFIGHRQTSTKFTKRFAYRYYVYHTPDYEFAEMCNGNTKFAQGPVVGGMHAANGKATIQYYGGWNNWTYANGTKKVGDCCTLGPGPNAEQPLSFFQGKWLRVEGVVTNRAGGASPNGFTFKLYIKNVTDGTPEIKVVDTTLANSPTGPSTDWLGRDDLTPDSIVADFFSNNYREGNCKGFRAVSHYMAAGWDTDEGQRIGSAKEVEGVLGEYGTGATVPPDPGNGWEPNSSAVRK